MRIFFLLVLSVMLGLGCARVRVEAPKEAIKVDVSMRLDIYQHVQKDIDEIDNMVSGDEEKPKPRNDQSFLSLLTANAYAQEEEFSPEVKEAAARRKERRPELYSWEGQGVIGENKSGLVEIRLPDKASSAVQALVTSENQDRTFIFQKVAAKNGTSVEEVQRLFAERHQMRAPSGTPLEVLNEANGNYEWQIKP